MPNLDRARLPPKQLFGRPASTRESPCFQSKVRRGCTWLDKKPAAPAAATADKVSEHPVTAQHTRARLSTAERIKVASTLNAGDGRPSASFASRTPKAVVFRDKEKGYVVERDRPKGRDERDRQLAIIERLHTRGAKHAGD